MTEEKYLENLGKIAEDIEKMIRNYGRRKDISVRFATMTDEELAKFSDWDQRRLGLIHGEDMFLVSEPERVLYAVNVTGDSLLTAAYELMRLVSAKF